MLDTAVDGTLVLVLSVALAPVTAWALVAGMLYPTYLLVRWGRPRWRRQLPRSRRRRLVGGAVCGTLCVLTAPPWPEPAVQLVTVPVVVLLTWSFVLDARWLERAAG